MDSPSRCARENDGVAYTQASICAHLRWDVVMNISAGTSQQYLLELLRSDVNRRGLLPSTSAEYVRLLRPLTQTVPDVIALTQAEIVSWISERDTPSKRRFRWLAIKALFRMLVEDQLVESNPCDKIKMPREQARPHDGRREPDQWHGAHPKIQERERPLVFGKKPGAAGVSCTRTGG